MASTRSFKPLAHKDLLSLAQLTSDEVQALFQTAGEFKRNPREFLHALEGQTIVLLFEKDSLRTLVSFEVGMAKLGGRAVYLDHRTNRIGQREPIRDYAKNLERWTEAIVARTYEHSTIESLAKDAKIPVINALSNLYHPCQGLADYFTLQERFGSLDGLKLAYIGDGNNVCHSLMIGAAKLGLTLTVIAPKSHQALKKVIDQAQVFANDSGAKITISDDPAVVSGHDAVYTDTWTSMGQEDQAAERVKVFQKYQVTDKLMRSAGPDAVFMHCLPAHRGEEVAADVIDSPRSIVYDQAENRMHVQNALLLHLLGSKSASTKLKPKHHASVLA
ncbi:MAG: ornithine carbamoyltransferase [Phycisphaerales bacterium]|nr:ornithine carbamoyltransferase [Phycisphaerales bacterium]MCI0632156.1 ornithine carbamoyltransferase [Phycisphaerales bacterium]MCI0675012.1 ornithine carbamoyltransferase [Phycisphaerales bacterium]